MHINLKRAIKVFIVIIPIATLVAISFNIISEFTQKTMNHIQASKDKEIQKYINEKNENGKIWVDDIISLFEIKNKQSQENIKIELQKTIDLAYKNSHKINKKYKKTKSKKQIRKAIKSELSKMKYDSTSTAVFLADYRGNTLLGSNSKVDMDARTILLEEIQKVRRRGGGFITSRVDSKGTKRYILVKDLGINDLFIGTDIYVKPNGEDLKEAFLDITKNTMIDFNDCISVSEDNKSIYSSKNCIKNAKDEYKYSAYSKVLNWTLTYSFYSTIKIQAENQKVENFEKLLEYGVK